MSKKKDKKPRNFVNPADVDPIRISDDLYKKLRRTRNEKTKAYEWGWFTFKEVVPVTDREKQLEVPRKDRPKAVWVAEFPDGADKRPTVYITCPHCAAIMKVDKHEIKADGELNPCVVCPSKGCDKHCFMRLKGWTHGALPSIGGWEDYTYTPRPYTPSGFPGYPGYMGGFDAGFPDNDCPVDPLFASEGNGNESEPGRSSTNLPALGNPAPVKEERRRWWSRFF